MGRHATLHVTAADRELEADQTCRPIAARMLRDLEQGHVIVPFWSAHQVTIAFLALERFGFRAALQQFEIVADQSFAGQIMAELGAGLDLAIRPIHTRGNAKRLEDVGAWLRNPKPFFIAVDGGSTYGTVPTGIVRMAARLRSTLWPVAVSSRPSFRVPGLVAEFPFFASSLAFAIANPLRIERSFSVVAAAADLKGRLDTATKAAHAILSPGDLGSERIWNRLERAS